MFGKSIEQSAGSLDTDPGISDDHTNQYDRGEYSSIDDPIS
ncbi:MAG: hypothetical protein H6Q93_1408 [Nitrospirae bacterium]|nr:hypothetical protein [Nitrospirota bacterium]